MPAALSVDPSDVRLVRRWAGFYRTRGYNPLPMRADAKRPFVRYSEWWETPTPADLFDRFEPAGVQVMTGRRWRLLVVDLDGPEARDRWARLGRCPRTWATHSRGDGLHLWFTLPPGLPELRKAVLWKGDAPHSAIERLCDRSLIVAPPSLHPGTGRRYRFASRAESPAGLPMPAECPGWVLALEPVRPVAPAAPPIPVVRPRPGGPRKPVTGRVRAADVLATIPDKAALAASWGLRITGRRAGRGALECHAIGREDRHPSALLNPESGLYWDPWIGRAVGLFELAARLGVYRDWREAAEDLAGRYGVKGVA